MFRWEFYSDFFGLGIESFILIVNWKSAENPGSRRITTPATTEIPVCRNPEWGHPILGVRAILNSAPNLLVPSLLGFLCVIHRLFPPTKFGFVTKTGSHRKLVGPLCFGSSFSFMTRSASVCRLLHASCSLPRRSTLQRSGGSSKTIATVRFSPPGV